jgi:CRISPR/Cas system-associated endoribonuclease Cas2
MQRLKTRLEQLINEQEDDVRFYPLNKADIARVYLLGKAQLQSRSLTMLPRGRGLR